MEEEKFLLIQVNLCFFGQNFHGLMQILISEKVFIPFTISLF